MKIDELRIAIDGGAATGKSTISKLVAKKLSLNYINTGQMYRLFTFYAIKNNLLNKEEILISKLKELNFYYKNGLIKSDNYEFNSNELESVDVTNNVSKISAMKMIREFATELQIKMAEKKGILLEGRDIGTIIMPNADFKFFLIVNPEIAAKRRIKNFEQFGEKITYDDVLKKIIERNVFDSTRKIAPLVPAKNSIIIDTSNNNADEIANKIIKVILNG